MTQFFVALVLALPLFTLSAPSLAADAAYNALRGSVPINEEGKPAPMYTTENKDIKRPRAYSMQPPTIPHKIDGYQVDQYANKCLSCHSRVRTGESQAPMVSVTHYQDRDGNFLAEISPRRYFCGQCHVAQVDAKPLVVNTFEDVDEILKRKAAKPGQ
ncbi:nitrate reductase cytochrome c-type subunit [Permianibacter sp. IMCC34836]|uniref:nitrate reductase cytochrome c-type subunit n=1 Tax=Permianibacter fluminis TaxID=2738515 RepID=UPI0015543802|nr:nitrate reductase cytochrome c-type subunit [Permianibacter fluminis]NQD37243.1 nitrate reductase cytochrome c-type subunit [Permianibacter fluminis]